MRTLLGNANLTGALLACFMDNTLPGKTLLHIGLKKNWLKQEHIYFFNDSLIQFGSVLKMGLFLKPKLKSKLNTCIVKIIIKDKR